MRYCSHLSISPPPVSALLPSVPTKYQLLYHFCSSPLAQSPHRSRYSGLSLIHYPLISLYTPTDHAPLCQPLCPVHPTPVNASPPSLSSTSKPHNLTRPPTKPSQSPRRNSTYRSPLGGIHNTGSPCAPPTLDPLFAGSTPSSLSGTLFCLLL